MQTLHYFASLRPGKQVLWCYLIWYLVTAVAMFDPTPRVWINSLGISAIVGFALLLSVSGSDASGSARKDYWQIFRLFMMPFGVSSFSTLIKGKGYLFVFPSEPRLLLVSVVACAAFIAFTWLARSALPAKGDVTNR